MYICFVSHIGIEVNWNLAYLIHLGSVCFIKNVFLVHFLMFGSDLENKLENVFLCLVHIK
jgi:hypothetical protein